MKKFLVGLSLAFILLFGSLSFSPLSADHVDHSGFNSVEVAIDEDLSDSGAGALKPMDNTDPGDSGVG